jgi:drug/metabolite transporter (DMT)-like permease
MDNSQRIGVAAALSAAAVWSLNFVVPFVIGRYSIFDFALFRFVVSGLVGLVLLIVKSQATRSLSPRDYFVAAWLAFIGYVGYFLTVAASALYAGPVIAPAFLGLVPIVLAITGNIRQGTVPWRSLSLPLVLITLGLLLTNNSLFQEDSTPAGRSLLIGIPLAVGAVVLWTWFGIANQVALAARPGIDSTVWTALMLVAGGAEMLAFFPFGSAIGLFKMSRIGLGWAEASSLYIWGISLAILASVGGAWAWTVASRRLPVSLAAQLIVSETAFGTTFGLIVHERWPTVSETCGILSLIAGVIVAIRAFHCPRPTVNVFCG